MLSITTSCLQVRYPDQWHERAEYAINWVLFTEVFFSYVTLQERQHGEIPAYSIWDMDIAGITYAASCAADTLEVRCVGTYYIQQWMIRKRDVITLTFQNFQKYKNLRALKVNTNHTSRHFNLNALKSSYSVGYVHMRWSQTIPLQKVISVKYFTSSQGLARTSLSFLSANIWFLEQEISRAPESHNVHMLFVVLVTLV